MKRGGKNMYLNIMVCDQEDKLQEISFPLISAFLEEAEKNSLDFPYMDCHIISFDYKGTEMEVSWNEEDLRDRGIVKVSDLYEWLTSEECDWFDE